MTRKEVLQLTDRELDKVVKIAGTKFDRRRKLTDAQITKIKKLVGSGKSLSYVAAVFDIDPSTVKYHADEEFKNYKNSVRKNYAASAYNPDTVAGRATYKRALLQGRKAVIF